MLCLVTQSCPTLCDPMDCNPPGSSVCGDIPAKNTDMGCHALIQGIFPTQGSNPSLLHWADSLLSEPPGETISYSPQFTTLHSPIKATKLLSTFLLKWRMWGAEVRERWSANFFFPVLLFEMTNSLEEYAGKDKRFGGHKDSTSELEVGMGKDGKRDTQEGFITTQVDVGPI